MLSRFLISTCVVFVGLAAPARADADANRAGTNLRRTVVVTVAEKTKPAVVNISATKLVRERVSLFRGDPFFERFGPQEEVQRQAGSLGSGFIVHPQGYVVTNHHVIDRARSVTVELADGRKLAAEVISSDADSDLAVLKINEKGPFPTIDLGDSSDLLIGEPVIAVGNPLGYAHSVSTGIVSALHRDLRITPQFALKDVIQTDAAINPGNSGGPLLNAYGQVIGINTAIRGDAQNIGFAIPVNTLRDMIPDLLAPKQTAKVDLPFVLRERRMLTPPAGVKAEVLLDGRVVARIRGEGVTDIVDAYVRLLGVRPGDEVAVELADGEAVRYSASELPLPQGLAVARERLGLKVESVTPATAQKFGLAVENGVLVTEVARRSPSAEAGVQPGDVIVQIGRYWLRDGDDLAALMNALPERGRIRLGIVRGNQSGYVMVEL
jgi:S1-C subfamily serine protease